MWINDWASLIEILGWRAHHQPDRRAYSFLTDGATEEVSLTYRELDRRTRTIGAGLADMGASGERALLLYPPRTNRVDPRLMAVLHDARATFALTQSTTWANYQRHQTRSARGMPGDHRPGSSETFG